MENDEQAFVERVTKKVAIIRKIVRYRNYALSGLADPNVVDQKIEELQTEYKGINAKTTQTTEAGA